MTVLGPENLGAPVMMRLAGTAADGGRKRAPEPEADAVLGAPSSSAAMDEDEGEKGPVSSTSPACRCCAASAHSLSLWSSR